MVCLVFAACGGSSSPAAPSGPTGSSTPTPSGSTIPACSAVSAPFFDALPIALSDFIAFRPLGFLSVPIHTIPAKHSAFSMTLPGNVAAPRPVRAPGRVWVKEIWEASFSTGARNYQLYLYPCNDVRVYFGHVVTISATLSAALAGQTPSCSSSTDGTGTVTICRYLNLAVPLASGEQFGTGPDTAGVDFGLVDFRRAPAAFARIDHYDAYYPYWASPLEYFRADVRSQIESQTGSVFGTVRRTASPVGGTHMQDVTGTAQGNWFQPGRYYSNQSDSATFLGLASDYVDPGQPMMAIGASVQGLSAGLYSFDAVGQGATNRAFRDVKADGTVYCYDSFTTGQSTGGLPLTRPGGVILLSMPDASSLRVQFESASSCASAPRAITSSATTFER